MYLLGVITGASGAYYNHTTGVSGIGTFAIPTGGIKGALWLEPSISGLRFALSAATGVTAFIQAAGANTAPLQGPGILNGPFRFVQGPNFALGVFAPGATQYSCKAFLSPAAGA